ncbi:MAG: DMT family transporter, partial [Candidatus Binatota bacterium]
SIIFFATALWGFYCVMAKPLMQYFSPLALTAMTTGIGAVFLLPAAFFELSSTPAQFGGYELLAILYLGIFPSFLSFLLWNRSVLTFGPGRATLVYNTIPFFAIILSAIFLGERLMLYQGVGGAVIIAGVVIGTSDRVS